MQNKKNFYKFIASICIVCSIFLGAWGSANFLKYKKISSQDITSNKATQKKPQPIENLTAPKHGAIISVTGKYLPQYTFLLQDRFYKNQQGFEIFTILSIKNKARRKKLVLVNRGWLPKNKVIYNNKTNKIPLLPANHISHTIIGYSSNLYRPKIKYYFSKNNYRKPSPWIVNHIPSLTDLKKITGGYLYPFALNLDPQQENGFIRNLPLYSQSTAGIFNEMIMLYISAAIMLLLAVIIFLVKIRLNYKKNHEM